MITELDKVDGEGKPAPKRRRTAGGRVNEAVRDLFFVASVASLAYGVWMIFPPAALIVMGALGLAASVWRHGR